MRIDVKQDDMVDATLVHWRGTLLWLGVAAIASLLVALADLLLQAAGGNRWPMFLFFTVMLAALVAAFRFLYIPNRAQMIHRRLALRPYTLTYNDDLITWKSETGSGGYPWNAFVKWREGKRVFLLYRNRTRFQVIPKAAFGDSGAVDAFRALLTAKIGKR
jgi:hypothetical protein